MAISETKGQGWRAISTQWRKASDILTSTLAAFLFSSHPKGQTRSLTQCECYVITLKCIIFIFSLLKTKCSVIFASSQNKRKQIMSITELSKGFFHCFCCRQQSQCCLTGWTISWFCWLQSGQDADLWLQYPDSCHSNKYTRQKSDYFYY